MSFATSEAHENGLKVPKRSKYPAFRNCTLLVEVKCDSAQERVGVTASQSGFKFSQVGPQQTSTDLEHLPLHPPDGKFSLWLMEDETELVFSGYIAHGVADTLSQFLDRNPQVRIIGLYSGGGRISEGIKVGEIIRSRGLDTYVYNQCLSACTIAYLGGINRYMYQDVRMGFHRSSIPNRIEFENTRNRDLDLVADVVSFGVDPDFAAKAYMVPNSSMWFPTVEELVQAGFVTHATYKRFSTSVLLKRLYDVSPLESAIAALERGEYKTAVRLFRPLAERGDSFAQFVLGFIFGGGKGVPQDHKRAATWYRLAAEQGHASAQNNLGISYSKGWGVPQDEVQAIAWFRKAAGQGDVQAQINLARRYYRGIGISQDYREAARWYRLAAEQGDAFAQLILGVMYSKGEGVPLDYVASYMWLSLAVSSGKIASEPKRKLALNDRDIIGSKLTPSELAEAKRRAREWQPN